VAGAKPAVLTFAELRREGDHSLLEINLVTGRYHQIRAQLAFAGMPVVGDRKYGGRAVVTPGIFLHHARMEFPHPVGGETVLLEAPPPEPWQKGIQYAPSKDGRRGAGPGKRRRKSR
jgi:23S rRNA pseudouridine1911/1915/1917 synthase